MPKRFGHLWEKMITEENCIAAEVIMGKNKPDNRMAKYIAAHPEKYGKTLREHILAGYRFSEPRHVTIRDSYKGKERKLGIPCLEDQAAMQAWLNIATPYIERRNYYYNCGSIPGAGQSRAVNGLKRKLKGRKPPKWGTETDLKKFYETCPHKTVLTGLRKIFKDPLFVGFAEQMMNSMSGTGIGLAIGFPVSHWFANVALMELDMELRRRFPDVFHWRYMDDVPMASNNKRHLRRALKFYMESVAALGMRIKRNWQVFRIKIRGITFLSYRFFPSYTMLTKQLMYRISRRIKSAARNMTVHAAQGVVSYMGILKHCDSHNYFVRHVAPFVNPKKCRRIISNDSKDILRLAA